jgi:hypothetical protein
MIKYSNNLSYNIKLLDDGQTIRKTANCSQEKSYDFIKAVVKHFIRYPSPDVVPVYDFQFISKKDGLITYSYDMMRMGILSEVERELIDRVGDLYDTYSQEACFLEHELYLGSVDYPDLFNFLKVITLEGRYYDIHSGNILMDPDGNYRLIDLEGFLRIPLELKENNWISRTQSNE